MKKVFILVIVIMLLFSLAACKPQGESYDDEWYDELEDKAKQTYIDTYLEHRPEATKDNDVWMRNFLGVYNGVFVTVFGATWARSVIDLPVYVELDGIKFLHSQDSPIEVWHENKIYYISEAYENKLITKENLITIKSLYHRYDGANTEQIMQLKESYLQHFGSEFNFDKMDDIEQSVKYEDTRFYGTYNDAMVIFKAQDGTSSKTVQIASAKFSNSKEFNILVWHEGTFYDLEEDYDKLIEKGILKQENIETISSIHFKFNKCLELYKYKIQKTTELENYAKSKDESKYSQECWDGILLVIRSLKELILDAHCKMDVDNRARPYNAKALIDEVPTKDSGMVEKFKDSYVNNYIYEGAPQENITDFKYLGTYNGNHVALIGNNYNEYEDKYIFKHIGEYVYYIPANSDFYVLSGDKVFTLETACLDAIITSGNLFYIKILYRPLQPVVH